MARNNQAGLTPEQKKARARARARRRAERQRQRQQARLNPLNAPFKTPAQLRAEAQRMAELSVVPEATLRQEQERQESGLGALTGSVAGALGGYQQQVAGGLQGLGQMYQNIAGSARQAGGEALAAAGVAPTEAPSVSPTVASEFANLTAATSGFVPAIQATGQRLIGESRLGLTKALTDRANTLSSNMAKYLDELKQREYEKAVAQEVNRQNIARLGLQEQQIAADIQMDAANLELKRQGLALDAQQLLLNIEKEANRQTNKIRNERRKKNEKIRIAKQEILANADELFKVAEYPSGKFKWTINYTVAPSRPGELPRASSVEIEATSEEDAFKTFKENYGEDFNPTVATRGAPATIFRAPTTAEATRSVVKTLMKAGMTRKAALEFIRRRLNFAFSGGVGGG